MLKHKFTNSEQFLTCLINCTISITIIISQLLNFATNACNFTEVESACITNGKTVYMLLLSLLFVYVQLVHHRYVLMVYCKQFLIGAENMISAVPKSHKHLVACLPKMMLKVVDKQIRPYFV